MVRNSWAEQEDNIKLQEQGRGKSRSEMQKAVKNGEVYFIEWFCVVHGEEVHEKVQRYFLHLFRNRAQDEKRGDGRAVQTQNPRKDGGRQLLLTSGLNQQD